MQAKRGPYITLVAFCDEVRENSDRTRDLVGQCARKAIETDGTLETIGIVTVSCGTSPGRHRLRLTYTDHAGKILVATPEQDLDFTQIGQECAFFVPVGFAGLVPGGLIWLNVSLDGQEVARSPLLLLAPAPESGRQVVSITRPKTHEPVN